MARRKNQESDRSLTNCPSCGVDLGSVLSEQHLAPIRDEIRRDLEKQFESDLDGKLAAKELEIASKTSELAERAKKDEQTRGSLEAALKELAQMRTERDGVDIEIEKARLAGADEARLQLEEKLEARLGLAEKRGKDQAMAELHAQHNLDKQHAAAKIDSLAALCGQLEAQVAAGVQDREELVRNATTQAETAAAEKIATLTALCGRLEAQVAAGVQDREELVRNATTQAETAAAEKIATLTALCGRLEAQVAAGVQDREELVRNATTQAETAAAEKFTALRAQMAEQAAAAQDARESSENQLRDLLRESEDSNARLRIEKASLRDQYEDEVREAAIKLAEDTTRKERARVEAKAAATIQDLKNQLTSVNAELQKVSQHSYALGIRRLPEGVIRQELFADELRKRWPQDDIVVVRRGQKGADVHQTVVENGQVCGLIVWECKATKTYSKAWIPKLIQDRDEKRARIAVLVTEAMPTVPTIEGSGWIDGILVCDFETAVHIAGPFRQMVATTRQHELTDAARGDRTPERVFTYVNGNEFMYCLEKIVKLAQIAREDMDRFRREFNRLNAKMDAAQQEIIDTICTIAGRFEAAGTVVPPQLRGELPSGERLALPPGDDTDL
ncbi:DUF2130 domain-containing protein [Nocardia sp. CDC160]|uniref:DUF2130 domain-containing protein n=1 Tax=Nocardia sp. CDC160 TaxID=3112166 RepID=UPI002DB78D47|nr:DUF2130 domain-containing protein [Nocardia sp. CDC160]MEC3915493.1 DUF2130 domain-containing protein [Nocardia sp. CDC160]